MLLLKSLLHLLEFCLFYIINRKSIIPKIALIWQENQRYKRFFNERNIKLPFSIQEKWFIRSMFISNPKARRYFTLVTPETILYRWKRAIKDYWTYDKPITRKRGRPPITKAMKLLINNLKIDNYLWGSKRIQDELVQISIDISRETIRKVIVYQFHHCTQSNCIERKSYSILLKTSRSFPVISSADPFHENPAAFLCPPPPKDFATAPISA